MCVCHRCCCRHCCWTAVNFDVVITTVSTATAAIAEGNIAVTTATLWLLAVEAVAVVVVVVADYAVHTGVVILLEHVGIYFPARHAVRTLCLERMKLGPPSEPDGSQMQCDTQQPAGGAK